MKKILLTLLVVVVALGLLAGAGFVGYRIGFTNGTSSNGAAPGFGRSFQMNPQFIPLVPHDDFGRGSDHYSIMMRPAGFNGRNMGFFSPLQSLWNIALLGLVIWFAYWLFTKSGWQISRKMDAVAKPNSTDPEGN